LREGGGRVSNIWGRWARWAGGGNEPATQVCFAESPINGSRRRFFL
jgi:hypothetical protein